ncbi:hypothetical protein SprV_0200936700 [Sparganum proliferum]
MVIPGDFSACVAAWEEVLGLHGQWPPPANLSRTPSPPGQHPREATVWMHPRWRRWHPLCYVLVRRRVRQDVLVTKAVCDTYDWMDHRVGISEMSLRLQSHRGPQGKRTPDHTVTTTSTASESTLDTPTAITATTSNADSVASCPHCDLTSGLADHLRIPRAETGEPASGSRGVPTTHEHSNAVRTCSATYAKLATFSRSPYKSDDFSTSRPDEPPPPPTNVANSNTNVTANNATTANLSCLHCRCACISRIGPAEHRRIRLTEVGTPVLGTLAYISSHSLNCLHHLRALLFICASMYTCGKKSKS